MRRNITLFPQLNGRKLFRILSFALIFFQIRIAVDLAKQTSKDELGMEHTITMALIFANNLANPFIYVACRRRYRNSLKLLCCGHCNGESPMDSSAAFVVAWTARNTQVLRSQKNELGVGVQMTPIEVFNREGLN